MIPILLIGATGFVGRHLLQHFYDQFPNFRIITYSRSEYRLNQILSRLDPLHTAESVLESERIYPLYGDLTLPCLGLSAEQYSYALSPSIVVHAVGPLDLQMNETQAELLLSSATQFIAHLAVMKQEHALRHVIYLGASLDTISAAEHSSPVKRRLTPYERVKLREEAMIRHASEQLGVPLSVVNPGVIMGGARTGAHEQQQNRLGLLVRGVRCGWLQSLPLRGADRLPLVSADTVAAFVGALASIAEPRSDTHPLLDPAGQQPGASLTRRIARELRIPAPLRRGREYVPAAVEDASTRRLQERYSLASHAVDELLPYVIADIDYRISHQRNITISMTSMTDDSALSRPEELDMQLPGTGPASLRPHRYQSGYQISNMPLIRGRRGRLASWELPGEASKPILVFVHGAFSSSDLLLPIAPYLQGIPQWYLDLPGFGRSPYGQGNFIEDCVAAVIEAIRTADRPVVLAGHSLGGWVVYKLMETASELVEHLLLLQPILQPVSPLHRIPVLNQLILRWMNPWLLMQSLLFLNCYEKLQHIPRDLVDMVMKELSSPRIRSATAQSLAALSKQQTFQHKMDVAKYAERISVLWGYHDHYYKLPKEILPHRVTRVPYGHYLPVSHPADTAAWIKARLLLYVKGYSPI